MVYESQFCSNLKMDIKPPLKLKPSENLSSRTILSENCFNNPDFETLRTIRMEYDVLFQTLYLDKTEQGWMLLSLAEIISNLLKHPEQKPKKIIITVSLKKTLESGETKAKEKYVLDVQDDSTAFEMFEDKKQKSLDLLDSKILTESGRGLGLLARAHPDHQYIRKQDSEDGLNHMRIRQPVNLDIKNLHDKKMHQKIETSILDFLYLKETDLPKGWKGVIHSQSVDETGGDFLFCHRKKTMSSLLLADVMGHGPQAKFLSYVYGGFLYGLFQTMKGKRFRNSAMVLRQIAKAIHEDQLLEQSLMTCLAVTLESDGRINLSSAGHPKPYIIRRHCYVVVEVSGPVIGLHSKKLYKPTSYTMKQGERLLLFTDGFCDADIKEKSEENRRQKIIKLVAENSDRPLQETADIVWNEFLSWYKDIDQKDDASFILLEYGGDPPS